MSFCLTVLLRVVDHEDIVVPLARKITVQLSGTQVRACVYLMVPLYPLKGIHERDTSTPQYTFGPL